MQAKYQYIGTNLSKNKYKIESEDIHALVAVIYTYFATSTFCV